MTKKFLNWMDEDRLHVPSMLVTEDDDDEIEMIDTGRVDKNGDPIVVALSHKQGFAGFIPPGEYERIQRAKEEAKAKQELMEIVEKAVTSTLDALGILKPKPVAAKPAKTKKAKTAEPAAPRRTKKD